MGIYSYCRKNEDGSGRRNDKELGYDYEVDWMQMVELQMDGHTSFKFRCKNSLYGGYLSVRKKQELKPLMMLGQDECIFNQFVFTKWVWILLDGSKQLTLKEEGQGTMLSFFCYRYLLYSFVVTDHILNKVNKSCENSNYSDEAAAIMIYHNSKKPKLTLSPFLYKVDYGNNHNGYWPYDYMIIQLKDCIDILKYTHPDFDCLFLLDHSNEHDYMQPNCIWHARKQPIMRSSKLASNLFDPFHTLGHYLQPKSIQSMWYWEGDSVPCY